MKPQAKLIRQIILEYAGALAAEAAGSAIVVYIDESYIHAHHSLKKGWFHPNHRDVIGDDDGKRLIILHAMTDNGLLAVPDTVASNWLREPALTAELVFEELLEDGQDDSDYHNTMTGVKFTAWLRNRLLPTFAAMYPGEKMYFVLDNASYHCPAPVRHAGRRHPTPGAAQSCQLATSLTARAQQHTANSTSLAYRRTEWPFECEGQRSGGSRPLTRVRNLLRQRHFQAFPNQAACTFVRFA